MTAVALPPAPPSARHRRRRWPFVLFAATFAVYATAGALLVFRYNSLNGDAQARVANAYYVVFSRDPHLGAIGFVWNPLPSLLLLPILPLKAVWPALTERAFVGNLVSAASMAAAVVVLAHLLLELRLRRSVVVVLVAGFAANPMIVYYAANGMTEALFILTLLVITAQLLRWSTSDATMPLVTAALTLALAYLTRSEAVGVAAATGALVAAVAAVRARSRSAGRIAAARSDALVFLLPFALAFGLWAFTSWLLVGSPFEQFTSQYGNSSQIDVMVSQGFTTGGFSRALDQVWHLAPFLGPLVVVGLVSAARRRDGRVLIPAAVMGGALGFSVTAAAVGATPGWLRYQIVAVPFAVVLAGVVLAPRRVARPMPSRRGRVLRAVGAPALAVLVALPAVATSVAAMADRDLGREERMHLAFLFTGRPTADDIADRARLGSSVSIARDIDHRNLRRGSVIVDTFTPCVPFIVLASHDPRQFVITNDSDFKRILADPATFGARFLLVPSPSGLGGLDAINRAYPTLYESGAGIAKIARDFSSTGCPELRLYEVVATGAGA